MQRLEHTPPGQAQGVVVLKGDFFFAHGDGAAQSAEHTDTPSNSQHTPPSLLRSLIDVSSTWMIRLQAALQEAHRIPRAPFQHLTTMYPSLASLNQSAEQRRRSMALGIPWDGAE